MIKRKLSMKTKYMLEAYVFISPFVIGLIIFFAFPFLMSVRLGFSKVIRPYGFIMQWVGLKNYFDLISIDTRFIPMLLGVLRQTMVRVPLVLVFSLIFAVFINKSLRFRGVFRTVFFLPFIIGMGNVMEYLVRLEVHNQVLSLQTSRVIPPDVLLYLGPVINGIINTFFGQIVLVLWCSGVQILLFLSGLQGISPSLYESAEVDGATEWEKFWLITVPMITPIILLNTVYTITDLYMDVTNPVLGYIKDTAFKYNSYGYAAAIGITYFIFILFLVLLVFIILGKKGIMTNVKGGSTKHENH